MTRNFLPSAYAEMDRYRQHIHCPPYDARIVPSYGPYGDVRAMRSAPSIRLDHGHQDMVDQDPPANNGTPRRRIAVACSRCRKRKIKCSGDGGSGLGCHNCRAAGVEQCTFFRVGSNEVNLDSLRSGRESSGYLPATHSNVQQYHHWPQGHQHLTVLTRGPMMSSFYPNGDQSYDTDPHPDEYLLSPVTPITSQDAYGYGLHDSSRTWATSTANRYMPAYHSRQGEQDATNSYSYTSASAGRRLAIADAPSAYSTSSFHSLLPAQQGESRVLPLPTPASRITYQSSQYDTMHTRVNNSTIASSGNGTFASIAKTPVEWGSFQTATEVRDEIVASSRFGDVIAPLHQKHTAASSTTSDTSSLRYTSSSTSPGVSPTTATTSSQMSQDSGNLPNHGVPMSSMEQGMYTSRAESISETRLPRMGTSRASMYSFSIDKRHPSQGSLSACTDRLVAETSHVPTLQTNERPMLDRYTREISDSQAQDAHHATSISAINQEL